MLTLQQALLTYVEHKKTVGIDFSKGAQCLRSFRSSVGDKPLHAIQQRHVADFLDGPLTTRITWRAKYGLLRHFFLYWMARSELPALPLPAIRPPVAQTFVPYIYSRAELRRLLTATRISQKEDACKIDARTLRTLLLFLYGTGALLGESRRLECKDVDFRRRRITIRSGHFNRSREIPMGADLYKILRAYSNATHRTKAIKYGYFFITKDGQQLNETTIAKTFQRVRKIAGITRSDGTRYQPRLHDLRHTFAVHRMTSWFKHGGRPQPDATGTIGLYGSGRAGIHRAVSDDDPGEVSCPAKHAEPQTRPDSLERENATHEVSGCVVRWNATSTV